MNARQFNAMVARNIRFLREERGFSDDDVARLTGNMSRSLITKIEQNYKEEIHRKKIDLNHLELIAAALGVSIDVLLENDQRINRSFARLEELLRNLHSNVSRIEDEDLILIDELLIKTSSRGPREQAKALLIAGELSYNLGDFSFALKHFDHALSISLTVSDVEMVFKTIHQIARALFMLGEYDQLHRVLEEYPSVLESDDHERNAKLLLLKGMTYARQTKYTDAVDLMYQAIEQTLNYAPEDAFLGRCHQALGGVYKLMRKYKDCIEASEMAAQICGSKDDKIGEVYALKTIGEAYCEMGQNESAIVYFTKGLRISETVASFQKIDEYKLLYSISKCQLDLEGMINSFAELNNLELPASDLAEMCVEIARLSRQFKKHEEAYSFYEKSIQILQ